MQSMVQVHRHSWVALGLGQPHDALGSISCHGAHLSGTISYFCGCSCFDALPQRQYLGLLPQLPPLVPVLYMFIKIATSLYLTYWVLYSYTRCKLDDGLFGRYLALASATNWGGMAGSVTVSWSVYVTKLFFIFIKQ